MALRRGWRALASKHRVSIIFKELVSSLDQHESHSKKQESRDFQTSSPAQRKMPNGRKSRKINLDEDEPPSKGTEASKPESEKIRVKKSVSNVHFGLSGLPQLANTSTEFCYLCRKNRNGLIQTLMEGLQKEHKRLSRRKVAGGSGLTLGSLEKCHISVLSLLLKRND